MFLLLAHPVFAQAESVAAAEQISLQSSGSITPAAAVLVQQLPGNFLNSAEA